MGGSSVFDNYSNSDMTIVTNTTTVIKGDKHSYKAAQIDYYDGNYVITTGGLPAATFVNPDPVYNVFWYSIVIKPNLSESLMCDGDASSSDCLPMNDFFDVSFNGLHISLYDKIILRKDGSNVTVVPYATYFPNSSNGGGGGSGGRQNNNGDSESDPFQLNKKVVYFIIIILVFTILVGAVGFIVYIGKKKKAKVV